MEPKKNPKYDVHQNRGVYFKISLIITLAIVITAFNWSVPVTERRTRVDAPIEIDDILNVKITYHNKTETDKKPIAKERKQSPTEFIERRANELAKPFDGVVDQGDDKSDDPVGGPIGPIELPAELNTDSVFLFAERMPEPEGGYEAFYKTIRDNFKYPSKASRTNTQGKVFVQFTVRENGELADFNVINPLGQGCDEEAVRVIKLTRWKAGKQRGNPVKVRMVQPIYFSLKDR